MEELENKLMFAKIFFDSNEHISSYFPLRFKINTVNQYNCTCVKCSELIDQNFVKGSVNKKIENVYELNAVAHCQSCGVFNIHDAIRIREDDGILSKQFYMEGQGWVKQIFESSKKGFLERLFKI